MPKDYTHTCNPKSIYAAASAFPFPEWVDSQPIPCATEFEKKASEAFADTSGRRLPICSKVATFYSAADCFVRRGDFTDEIVARVKSAASAYGIADEVSALEAAIAAELTKQASAPSARFAIDCEISGEHFKLFPINHGEQVKEAAIDLLRMAADERIHYLQFVGAAREITKAAAEFGVEIHPAVESSGQIRFPDLARAADILEKRASACGGDLSEAYRDLAVEARSADDSVVDDLIAKLAAVETVHGVRWRYQNDEQHTLPLAVFRGGPLVDDVAKAARDHWVMVGETPIPAAAVRGIPLPHIDFRLSKSAAEDVTQLRDGDLRNLSLRISDWGVGDRAELVRMAVESAH